MTSRIGKAEFVHFDDYSGAVRIITEGGEVYVPFADLKQFVAEGLRDGVVHGLVEILEAMDDDALIRALAMRGGKSG